MYLEELLWNVNENTVVQVYSAETNDLIAEYDGKESIPEKYNPCVVTDIFVDENRLCIEIEEECNYV